MKTIILLGCGKQKRGQESKAKDLYTGNYYKKSLEYAQYLSKKYDADIYILSAKYGLIDPEDILQPYNFTLRGQTEDIKKLWSYKVIQKLEKIIIRDDRVIFLAGEDYTKYLKRYYKNYIEPLQGLRIGYRMQYINKVLREEENER